MRTSAIILVASLCLTSVARAGATIDIPREDAGIGTILHIEVSTSAAGQVHVDSTPPGAIVPADLRFARPGRVTIPIFVIADSVTQLVTSQNAAIAIKSTPETNRVGPTGCVVGLDAYRPTEGWRPSLAVGARTYAVLIAVLTGVALLGSALPQRRELRWLAFSIASSAAIGGIIAWQRASIRNTDGFGGMIFMPDAPAGATIDWWMWTGTRRSSVRHSIPLVDDTRPLWVDADHARRMSPALLVDVDADSQTLSVTLERDVTLATVHSMFDMRMSGSHRAGSTRPIDVIAGTYYPSMQLVGHILPSPGIGTAVLRPTTRPLK